MCMSLFVFDAICVCLAIAISVQTATFILLATIVTGSSTPLQEEMFIFGLSE